MAPTICVCVDGDESLASMKYLHAKLAGGDISMMESTTVDDYAHLKTHNDGIILVVLGRSAHHVIKYLCDDYDQGGERRVKLIYSLSAGTDAYRLPELKRELAGIPFCNAQGCYSNILAEHVIFSMLYFNRFPWVLSELKREKKWGRFSNFEVSSQKVVVIGYGDIGQRCGQKAAALGMEVTGIRRSGNNEKDSNGVMVRGNDALDECVREADFVIGVLPGTEHTKHFFNKELFAKMKPSAVFINIGRGMTQCEEDIYEALDNNIIRAAALDVFEVEPLPEDSPLWTLPDSKLLITAHMADWTDDITDRGMHRFMKIYDELRTHGTVSAYTVSTDKGY